MKIKSSISNKRIAILSTVAILFSCSNRLDQIHKRNQTDFFPLSIAENINTKYTDSGRLTSILVSSKMINFSNHDFPFYEFPEGIQLTLLDTKKASSTVVSNHAVVYNETDLIDLRGDVVLTTANNDTLFTDQLYYDQKKEWLFTDFPVKFRTKDYITNGNGFDANQDFTNAQVLQVTGRIYILE